MVLKDIARPSHGYDERLLRLLERERPFRVYRNVRARPAYAPRL